MCYITKNNVMHSDVVYVYIHVYIYIIFSVTNYKINKGVYCMLMLTP